MEEREKRARYSYAAIFFGFWLEVNVMMELDLDNRMCGAEGCVKKLVRRANEDGTKWRKRKFCSLGCLRSSQKVRLGREYGGNEEKKKCTNCGDEFSRRPEDDNWRWRKRQRCKKCAKLGRARGDGLVPGSEEAKAADAKKRAEALVRFREEYRARKALERSGEDVPERVLEPVREVDRAAPVLAVKRREGVESELQWAYENLPREGLTSEDMMKERKRLVRGGATPAGLVWWDWGIAHRRDFLKEVMALERSERERRRARALVKRRRREGMSEEVGELLGLVREMIVEHEKAEKMRRVKNDY